MARNKHYVGVRSAATAATARVAGANLWNPSGAARVFLSEAWVVLTTAGVANLALARSTARGTATTSLAMAAANSIENDTASPAGIVLDTAWSVAPTIGAADLIRWNLPAAIGAGVILPFPEPITIPPGTGIAVITPVAVILPASDITFVFFD